MARADVFVYWQKLLKIKDKTMNESSKQASNHTTNRNFYTSHPKQYERYDELQKQMEANKRDSKCT